MLAAYDWRIVTSTPAPEDVFLDVAQHPDRTVVTVTGEIDVLTVPGLRHVLFDPEVVIAPLVVVDLSAVTFMDSVGIGALVAARRWLTGRGTAMVLVCGDNQPRRVLTMTGLHKVFDIATPGLPVEAGKPEPV
jgi:anti-sigma B factor antagonist